MSPALSPHLSSFLYLSPHFIPLLTFYTFLHSPPYKPSHVMSSPPISPHLPASPLLTPAHVCRPSYTSHRSTPSFDNAFISFLPHLSGLFTLPHFSSHLPAPHVSPNLLTCPHACFFSHLPHSTLSCALDLLFSSSHFITPPHIFSRHWCFFRDRPVCLQASGHLFLSTVLQMPTQNLVPVLCSDLFPWPIRTVSFLSH